MEDNEYSDLLNYLSHKSYPRGYSDNQKKTLRRKARNYEYISGELYYYLRNASIPHKVLLTKERRIEAIATAHNEDETGRHHGIQKTTTRLLNELHCYWRGFTKDVRQFVKDCSVCKSGTDVSDNTENQNNINNKAINDSIENPCQGDPLKQKETEEKIEFNSTPVLQCRECNSHFNSKLSFRIHQRKHVEGHPSTQMTTEEAFQGSKTQEASGHKTPVCRNYSDTTGNQLQTCSVGNEQQISASIEGLTNASADFSNCNYRELQRSSSSSSSASSCTSNTISDTSGDSSSPDSSDQNMGSMTFKDEGLPPVLGDGQQGPHFPHPNPLYQNPPQTFGSKDSANSGKVKYELSDSNHNNAWTGSAEENAKRGVKEESSNPSQWWVHHHPENLILQEQWKNSNAVGSFCAPGDPHYTPVGNCNREVTEGNNLLQDLQRNGLTNQTACMVTQASVPVTETISYQTLPISSTCDCLNCKEAERLNAANSNLPQSQRMKVHSCHICHKVFRKTWHLKAHIRTHTGERPFACQWPSCGKRFTRSDKLHRHMGMHTGERRFSCFVCSKRFVRNDTLTQHLKTHNIYTAPASLQSGESVVNGNDNVQPTQMNCDTTTSSDGTCSNIQKVLPCKLKLYNCTYPGCERVFKKTWHLKAHMCTHTGEKPFLCTWPFCGKKFTRSDKLHRHMGSHTNGKQFYCPTCNKHLIHSDYITHHLQMHDGKDIKPPVGFNPTMYENTQGSSFVVSSSTSNPAYIQQPNSSDGIETKPSVSQLMDPHLIHAHHVFSSKIRIPKPSGKVYGCQMEGCSKVFKKSWHLKAHVRTHTGERPFACQWPLCGKRFARSDKLYRHMTLHTEGKRFACTLCSKRFVRNDNLKQHMKTHFKKNVKKNVQKEEKNQRQLISLVAPPSLHSFYPS